jgi:solute carrier family 30 (zinc transporter), member 1
MNTVSKKKTASMNMHGVFLHILADALGSIVVIISALIIKFSSYNNDDRIHWTVYVDPTLSVIMVIIISMSAIPLLRESTLVLLQTVPRHIEIDSLKKKLLDQVPEIESIHELHIWRLTSNASIASAHLRRRSLKDYMIVADQVKRFFHTEGIHSTTIQFEYQHDEKQTHLAANINEHEKSHSAKIACLLCCMDDACNTQTCCTRDLIHRNAISSMTSVEIIDKNTVGTLETCINMEDETPCIDTTDVENRAQASENDQLLKNYKE